MVLGDDFGTIFGVSGRLWEPLGGPVGLSGGLLGRPWALSWRSWSAPGATPGAPWELRGGSWRALGAPWGPGALRGPILDRFWRYFGVILGSFSVDSEDYFGVASLQHRAEFL